jgi:uncharacterized membrane protein
MKRWLRFVWRTIIGGVLFLGPLLLLLIIVVQGVRLIAKILNPVASHIPIPPMLGMAVPEIAAALLLILTGFLMGLLAQTALARRLRESIEQLILRKMPGYTLFKAVAEGVVGEHTGNLKVALANIDDAWLMSFIVEEHSSGMLTVFVPSAPTPTAGSIYYLTEQQVKRIDVPVSAAVKCIMQLGVGSKQLLEGKMQVQEQPERLTT